jgi:Anti-sigma factor NepR
MTERKLEGPKAMESAAASRGNKKTDGKTAKLSREVQSRLGQQLRAMYEDVVNQGVPDRFTELLNRIDGGNKDRQ